MNAPRRAGGRATEGGMSFQGSVGAWFAAHLVSEMPVGSRFGLSDRGCLTTLQLETGVGLDDIVVESDDNSAIFVQCKTRPSLESAANSDLGKTLRQLVRLVIARRTNPHEHLDPEHNSAVLAVAADAPRSLDDLHAACRVFDLGGQWHTVISQLSTKRRKALELFGAHVRAAWTTETGTPPLDEWLPALARLFHVVRFDLTQGGSDRREASRVLGARVYGREDAGEAPLGSLNTIVRDLIRSGAPANRIGLLRALRAAGHEDTRAPRFDSDIAQLQSRSAAELRRLDRHRRLAIGANPIPRSCLALLDAAIHGGSLLVTGEPGSGKTGVLVSLAERMQRGGAPVVFLSVDNLTVATTRLGLCQELVIQYDILEVLANWPGRSQAFLIIDALDASRGGPAESVFSTLIEEALDKLGERWSVIASIRTFDLKNGRRFRDAMRGAPPNRDFAVPGLDQVRHFQIKQLNDEEIAFVEQSASELRSLLESAPTPLRCLLRNVFNLSLAADLLNGGTTAPAFRSITTQSDLIRRYEDERLDTDLLQHAASAAIETMVDRQRLSVPRIQIRHPGIEGVLRAGVLVQDGDRVAFSHHVLFDHVASRFYLDWDNPDRLLTQIGAHPAIGLLLGPSLRFAVEQIWREDNSDRANTWALVVALAKKPDLDPIVASVALRTVADHVEGLADVGAMRVHLQRSTNDRRAIGIMLSRLARFVQISIDEARSISSGASTAWASMALSAIKTDEPACIDAARFLLWTLFERADFNDQPFVRAFGEPARALLAKAWTLEPPQTLLSINGIRFVAKSFGIDSTASRQLLEQAFQEPHFTQHAHEEATWIAEGISYIAASDPAFAVSIYATLFGRPVPQQGKTWIGGQRSQILALSSNRKQDYEQAYWRLGQFLPRFLEANPYFGSQAVVRAILGLVGQSRTTERATVSAYVDDRTITIANDTFSLIDWRGHAHPPTDPPNTILSAFATFLSTCSPNAFRVVADAVRSETASASVWARLFEVASRRMGMVDNVLWPVVTTPELISTLGLIRDAVTYLEKVYPTRTLEERHAFEIRALAPGLFDAEGQRAWRDSVLSRFLSVIPESALATDAMRSLRGELAQSGRLTGNRPVMSITTSWKPADNIEDRLLQRSGVDLERSPDREIRSAARSIENATGGVNASLDVSQIAGLWDAVVATVETIDAASEAAAHPETLHAAWGWIATAVERIAKSTTFDLLASAHPSLEDVVGLVSRLAESPYPEPSGEGDHENSMLAWGNWDVRVYAASSIVALAPRFGEAHPEIIARMATFLDDPVPAVRLQVEESLNVLWEVARPMMWTLARRIAKKEMDPRVLGFYVSGTLAHLAGADSAQCEEMLVLMLQRRPREPWSEGAKGQHSSLDEAIGGLVAWFAVSRGMALSQEWIDTWIGDLVGGGRYLWHIISSLRPVLYYGFRPEQNSDEIVLYQRSKGILDEVVSRSAEYIEAARIDLQRADLTEAERAAAEQRYVAADRLLDHACNQLYFGSGAFQSGNQAQDSAGLLTVDAKRLFLTDYETTLDKIGRSGTARTLHHMIELYAYLVDANPTVVFDRVADIVTGPAAEEGYQFEGLGFGVLVVLVRRYLADYRPIFVDPVRRQRLVDVLELFSQAGWPEALKLLYDLPDVLR